MNRIYFYLHVNATKNPRGIRRLEAFLLTTRGILYHCLYNRGTMFHRYVTFICKEPLLIFIILNWYKMMLGFVYYIFISIYGIMIQCAYTLAMSSLRVLKKKYYFGYVRLLLLVRLSI